MEIGEAHEIAVVDAEGGEVFHRVDRQGGIGGQRAAGKF
jgi:hypothetical protein